MGIVRDEELDIIGVGDTAGHGHPLVPFEDLNNFTGKLPGELPHRAALARSSHNTRYFKGGGKETRHKEWRRVVGGDGRIERMAWREADAEGRPARRRGEREQSLRFTEVL